MGLSCGKQQRLLQCITKPTHTFHVTASVQVSSQAVKELHLQLRYNLCPQQALSIIPVGQQSAAPGLPRLRLTARLAALFESGADTPSVMFSPIQTQSAGLLESRATVSHCCTYAGGMQPTQGSET
jgi:hypothetical protein